MIVPLDNKIQIEIDKPTAGGLDLSSKATGTEFGTILAIGENVTKFKVGDKILFKAWQLDIINYEGEQYNFLDANGEGICALIK